MIEYHNDFYQKKETALKSFTLLAQQLIPSSVTSIGSLAFSGYSSLKQITIPSKIDVSRLYINPNTTINRI